MNIFILAGEPSGDEYGAKLMEQLKKNNPQIIFNGIGGSLMSAQGLNSMAPFQKMSVMGFAEVIKSLFFFIKIEKKILTFFKKNRPDKIILIDYPGFNLSLAKDLKKTLKIPIIYYISPQVWAWRENRIKNIKNCIDEMAVIFPFEEKYYNKLGVNSSYVGHPLVENNFYKKKYAKNKNYIGFFPGSRLNEVKKHIPIIKDVIKNIHSKNPNEKFIISCSGNINKIIYKSYFSNKDYIKIISNENIYETIDMCKVAVAASGTITLQIALKKVPMCVFYKLSNITYLIAKFLVKTKFISLVNIILGKKVVNEFIQGSASPENITSEIEKLINNEIYRSKMIDNYDLLEKKLLNDPSKITIYDLIESIL